MTTRFAPQFLGEDRKKLLITADLYQQMGAVGLLDNDQRMELIDGEIYTMSPLSSNHNSHVDKIAYYFNCELLNKVIIRSQGSIRLDEHSEPEPDIALLKFDEQFYKDRQVGPGDIHLLVEVAISTAETDLNFKKVKYAESGIREYWVVLPEENSIVVFQNPENGDYREKRTYSKSDQWNFTPFDLRVKGEDLLL